MSRHVIPLISSDALYHFTATGVNITRAELIGGGTILSVLDFPKPTGDIEDVALDFLGDTSYKCGLVGGRSEVVIIADDLPKLRYMGEPIPAHTGKYTETVAVRDSDGNVSKKTIVYVDQLVGYEPPRSPFHLSVR